MMDCSVYENGLTVLFFLCKMILFFFVFLFYSKILPLRYSYKLTLFGMCFGQLAIVYGVSSVAGDVLYYMLRLVLMLLLLHVFFHGSILKKAVFVVILRSISMLSMYLVTAMDTINIYGAEHFYGNLVLYYVIESFFYLPAFAVNCGILYTIPRYLKSLSYDTASRYWIGMLLPSVLITASADLVFQYNYVWGGAQQIQLQYPFITPVINSLLMLLFATAAIVGNVAFIVSTDRRINHSLVCQQLNLQIAHYRSTEQSFEKLKIIRHDMKNHLMCLKVLLEQNQTEQAGQYLNGILETAEPLDRKISTGNPFADAILNEKYDSAAKQQISMEWEIQLPKLPVSSLDLCIILGNALDNAIEACNRMGDSDAARYIKLTIVPNRGYLLMEIKNSMAGVTISNDTLLSTKADKDFHGIGLQNMKATVEKYHGVMDIQLSADCFTLSIMLPVE